MSEKSRSTVKEFGSFRIVKVTYDMSEPIFYIEKNHLDALGQPSWQRVEMIDTNYKQDDKDWLNELLKFI